MVESDNPDLPNHIVSFEAFANEELEVKVNWPLASLYVPTISDGVSLKIKLPTDLDPTSTGVPYQGGEMIQTLAGKALVDAQFEGFPGNKPYEYEIKKGQNALILPWGYELTLDGQVLEKEIFAPWQPTVFRDEIPIPLIVNGQKVELSGSITVEPQQGKIQKFEITSSMLPLGQAQLDVQESKKELKKLLRPLRSLEVLLWHPSSLPYRWKMAFKSKRLLLEVFPLRRLKKIISKHSKIMKVLKPRRLPFDKQLELVFLEDWV